MPGFRASSRKKPLEEADYFFVGSLIIGLLAEAIMLLGVFCPGMHVGMPGYSKSASWSEASERLHPYTAPCARAWGVLCLYRTYLVETLLW